MRMPDGNTAALNTHEVQEAQAVSVPLAKSSRNLYVPLKLSLHKIHNDLLAITGTCPDDSGCPFCMNDRAERHAPNPGFCYTPERCAGKTCCPHNPSCTE